MDDQQSIQVSNESEHVDDEINADEEIKEVVEEDSGDLDQTAASTGDDAPTEPEPPQSRTDAAEEKQNEASESEGDGSAQGVEEGDANKEEQSSESAKKLLRMQLSTQTLQKLLKEGKMEKLPTGSFRISSEALKELRSDSQKPQAVVSPSGSEENVKKRKLADTSSVRASPSKAAKYRKTALARKRGGGIARGGARIHPKAVPPVLTGKKLTAKQLQTLQSAQQKMLQHRLSKTKKPKIHDYVSDFNSSEDDDGDQIVADLKDSLAELAPRKTDHFSKNMNLLFEQLHKSIFGSLSDESEDDDEKELGEEERMKQLAYSDPDFEAPDSSTGEPSIPDDFYMTGRVGNDGKTVMCIRSSGKRRTWNGVQYPVYTIDTSVEQSTTVTPLMVTALSTSPGCGLQKSPEDKTLEMSDPDLVEQLMAKNVSLRKYKEQVKVLRRRYLQLARHLASRPQLQTIGDLVGASSRFLTQDQLLFFTMQLKAGCDSTQGARFSTREKLLAMGLYQQDPETYKWLQRLFHLPSTAELERWLDSVARGNPLRVKQLMYYVYTRYCFRPRDDVFPHTLSGY